MTETDTAHRLHNPGRSDTVVFMLAPWTEPTFLLLCLHYKPLRATQRLRKFTELLRVEEMQIPSSSVMGARVNCQPGGYGWRGFYS